MYLFVRYCLIMRVWSLLPLKEEVGRRETFRRSIAILWLAHSTSRHRFSLLTRHTGHFNFVPTCKWINTTDSDQAEKKQGNELNTKERNLSQFSLDLCRVRLHEMTLDISHQSPQDLTRRRFRYGLDEDESTSNPIQRRMNAVSSENHKSEGSERETHHL